MTDVALGLGSNLGDRQANLQNALLRICALEGVRFSAVSSVWETPPWGKTDQPSFLNACLAITTDIPPEELLAYCLLIERAMGRIRDERWGPRLIDIDLLWHGNEEISSSTLTLPHPRITVRPFVLVPLAEIRPGKQLAGKSVLDWADAGGREDMTITGQLMRPG